MPIRDLLIPEASSAILEPISTQITYNVLERLGLNTSFGENVYITNDYTKPSVTSDENHNALISRDRCDVKMTVAWNPSETKYDVNSFKYTQAYGVFRTLDRSLIPIFWDKTAAIQLTEHQVPCSMALEFTMQFKNRETAFLAISAINNTSLKDSVINEHVLSYSYPISVDMFQSLYELFKLRQDFINLDFWTYLKHYSGGGVQYLQQRTGTQVELVIKRQDLKALGVLEYTQNSPSVQDENRGIDRFVVDFSYTIQFARPDVLRLQFPVVVGNRPVPEKMIRKSQHQFDLAAGYFQEASIGGYLNTLKSPTSVVIRLPTYDDFRPPQQPAAVEGFVEFFTSAFYLDSTPTTQINLLDLGSNLQLHDTVVSLMKLQGRELFETRGLFNVSIYCNGLPVDLSCLTIDENLVITLAMQNRQRRYHLVLSEATLLKNLSEKWYPTFIANRTFFPVTVIKNLQTLIDRKYCYVDRHNWVLLMTNQLIKTFAIDSIIQTLITAKHLNSFAYEYATTAEQFVEYLIHRISPVTGKSAYDSYISVCIAANLITEAQLSSGYILTPNGTPVVPYEVRGAISKFNLPLRILDTRVTLKQA